MTAGPAPGAPGAVFGELTGQEAVVEQLRHAVAAAAAPASVAAAAVQAPAVLGGAPGMSEPKEVKGEGEAGGAPEIGRASCRERV